MPPYLAVVLAAIVCATAVALLVSLWWKPLDPPDIGWLTKDELGEFEELLVGLEEVILIADSVTVPSLTNAKAIYWALVDNFIEEVQYSFVVPQHYHDEHGRNVTRKYHNIITVAEKASGKSLAKDLFRIHGRHASESGPDYPYLFYRFRGKQGHSEIVAFRGESEGVGIAENYRRLEPEVARTLLTHTLPHITGGRSRVNLEDYSLFSSDTVLPFKRPNPAARHATNGKTNHNEAG